MNNRNMPGFTAETSVYKQANHYRARADTLSPQSTGSVISALDNRKAKEAFVDCKTFPANVTCNECNSTGPGTFNCCELGGMRNPGDSCIIMNDPNARSEPPPRPPRFPHFGAGLGNSVARLR